MTHTYHADCECTECAAHTLAVTRGQLGSFAIVFVAAALSTLSLLFASALVSYLMFFR